MLLAAGIVACVYFAPKVAAWWIVNAPAAFGG